MSRQRTMIYSTMFKKGGGIEPVVSYGKNGSKVADFRVNVNSAIHAGIESVKGRWSCLVLTAPEVATLMTELLSHVPIDILKNDPAFADPVEGIKRLARMLSA